MVLCCKQSGENLSLNNAKDLLKRKKNEKNMRFLLFSKAVQRSSMELMCSLMFTAQQKIFSTLYFILYDTLFGSS